MIPAHFASAAHFAWYILECAQRDREDFLEAMTSGGYPLNENDQIAVAETKEELREIRKRIQRNRKSMAGARRPGSLIAKICKCPRCGKTVRAGYTSETVAQVGGAALFDADTRCACGKVIPLRLFSDLPQKRTRTASKKGATREH
jgi:hypothetical protein